MIFWDSWSKIYFLNLIIAETALCVTAVLQPAIQKMMHGFITNENNFQKYKYTYKERRKNITYGARRDFRNKHATYWSWRNATYWRQQDWSEWNGPLRHPSFTASTIATFCFVNAGLAYIIIHLLLPRHILLITTTDGCVNSLMEMTKMSIPLLKCMVS